MLTDQQRATHMQRLSTLPPMLASGREPDKLAQASYVESGMALFFDFLNNLARIAEAQEAQAKTARHSAGLMSAHDAMGVADTLDTSNGN